MGVLPGCRGQRLDDGLQHSRGVRKDLVVPEAQNAPALPLQLAVAQVMIGGAGMLAAIGLDDQPRFNADEIDDVGWDGEVAAKMTAQLPPPQATPKNPLGVRHVDA